MIPDRENIGSLTILDLIPMADKLHCDGSIDSALELYSEWIRRSDSPLKFVACFNLGVMLAGQHEPVRAKDAYEQALEFNPDFMQARLNLGTVLEQLGQQDDALAQWRLALLSKEVEKLESMPLRLHALNNLGRLLEKQRQFKSALDILEQSLALDTTQIDVMLHLVHLAQKICRWPIYAPPKGMACEELVRGTSPLAMLAASDDPAVQLAASQRFVAYKYPLPPEPLSPPPEYRHDKIRIGYLSSNLSTHAVSLLTVELFELHDRNRFEVYGFCWSPEDRTAFRQRVIKGFDHFIRIGELSDKEAAESIRFHEIDILVDLQGLTSGARPLILAYRPAPLQVTYLGFPGPTGLPWIDYVIADRYMIPEEEARFYTEKPLYLPNCFQVSDSKREVGPMPKRSDYSLPDNAFVYCSFNNNYKYTPEMFGAWMRILRRVPKSVLWLLADNEWAKENLCKIAEKMGVKKERLIFAPRAVPTEYLARYQLADLFLDTYPFNGGTTANDALFMGLPLLTLSGRTFASRYAGSLLKSLDLPELITIELTEYEMKAVRLATNHVELNTLKNHLMENNKSGPVYDTGGLVVGYENSLSNALYQHVSVVSSYGSEKYTGTMQLSSSENRQRLYCVGHIKPIFELNVPYTMLCPSSIGIPGELVISDERFGGSVDGASLAEYSQLFGLYDLIEAGDIIADSLFLFQYRKFLSPIIGGLESRSSWVRVVRPIEAPILFPSIVQLEEVQSARLVVGSLLGFGETILANYARVHVLDDFVMFVAACAKSRYLTENDLRGFVSFKGIIPSPALCQIKTDLFVKIMQILKEIACIYMENYLVKREGYQRRVLGYLLERLHSYLLCKWLQDGSEPNIILWTRYVVTND